MSRFSFQKGFDQVKNKDVKNARREIMEALKINSRYGWSRRVKGLVEPKVSEVEVIERIFLKYGVESDIWGTY